MKGSLNTKENGHLSKDRGSYKILIEGFVRNVRIDTFEKIKGLLFKKN